MSCCGNAKSWVILLTAIVVVSQFSFAPVGSAEDWPHWMGPTRNNQWEAKGIIEKFPAGGPKVLWRTPVEGGYSGPSVVGDRLFISDFKSNGDVKVGNFERKSFEGVERVQGLDAKSGKVLWTYEYPVTYGISYPSGPRCTPTVDGKYVYALGAEGHLVCLSLDGKPVWKKELTTEYKTKSALWGYASHPLIDGDRLICIVGGEGSHVVAFDKLTGKELWKSGTATEQGYTPPSIIEAAGVRQLIITSPMSVYALAPDTGKELWKTDYEATNGSIIMTPIQYKDYLLVAGYSNHNMLLQLSKDKPGVKKLAQDKAKHFLSPVNVQPFMIDDTLYGMDQGGDFMAIELPSGKRLWQSTDIIGDRSSGSETAFFVAHGNRHFIFNEKGELQIAKISKTGIEILDKAQLLEATNNAFGRPVVWAAPAFANGCVYLRNDKECICVDLKAK